jgi:uncharacterized membrane protein YvlD (DUF360 family)
VIVGIALLIVILGAVLTWAVSADVVGIDVHTVGVILLVAGLLGLVFALVRTFMHESWGRE